MTAPALELAPPRTFRLAARWWEHPGFAVAMVALMLVPLMLVAFPPLGDLPGHAGRYRVMLGTDADVLGQWYEFRWRLIGNLGVDLIVAGLGPVIGLEPAIRVAVFLIIGSGAAAILWLSREVHGRVSPFAAFALPLLYNYPFTFGFVNYALAMSLSLAALAGWLWLGRTGRTRLRAGLFIGVGAIVWTAHVVGWGALGLMVFGAEVARARGTGQRWSASLWRAGLACLPLALPLVLALAWGMGGTGGVTERFFDLEIKGWFMALVLRDRWFLPDVAATVLLYTLLYWGLRDARAKVAPLALYPAIALFAAFLILPFSALGSAYADMRLMPYALMLGLLALAPAPAMRLRTIALIAALGVAFAGARVAVNAAGMVSYAREWDRELAAVPHMPRGSRVASFAIETCQQPWGHRRLGHLPGLALARRAVFTNSHWAMQGGALLHIRDAGIEGFATDPSQSVLAEPCAHEPNLRHVNEALRDLPRDRFTHIWLIQVPPHDARLLAGTTRIWGNGRSALHRIDRPAAVAASSTLRGSAAPQ